MTHTPGPWVIDNSIRTAVNAGKKHIAMVNFYKTSDKEISIDEKENEANARLIAAAPELLAACKAALRDEMSARLEAAGGLSDETVAMLEAAIAKAEGK